MLEKPFNHVELKKYLLKRGCYTLLLLLLPLFFTAASISLPAATLAQEDLGLVVPPLCANKPKAPLLRGHV